MLALTTEQIGGWVGAFFWPFIRISAMMVAAPIFGARVLPTRVRVAIAFALSLVVAPMLPAAPQVDGISLQSLNIIVQQILIGVAIGFSIQTVFQALVVAGETIANSMGLGFARMMDPANGVQVPVISQFLIIMATLLFVVLNGHLLLIHLVVQSFDIIPVGEIGLSRVGLWKMANVASMMFAGGLMVAIPAVTALLLVNIAMGVVTRAAPQLNIFAVGFPMMILLGFIFLAASVPVIFTQFSHMLMQGFDNMRDILMVK